MGIERADAAGVDDVFRAYLRAKRAAEDDLRGHDVDWMILRPGRLTDDPGTGRVRLAESVEYGEVSRDDVAAVLVELIEQGPACGEPSSWSGETPRSPRQCVLFDQP